LGVVAPGGVELVEPIWSCPSSLLSLVALCGVSSDDEGTGAIEAVRRSGDQGSQDNQGNQDSSQSKKTIQVAVRAW
jgi:hypothetical protein